MFYIRARDYYIKMIFALWASVFLSGCLAEEVATSTSNFSASDFSGADLATATSSSTISVSWTLSDSSIVTGYRIYEMDEALQLTPLGVVGRSTSSYLAVDLEPESTHYYVVRALLSDGGIDENMKFVSATTLETDPLSVSPSAVSIATGSIKTLVANGGAKPYSFNILSGGGVIHPSTGEFVAPSTGGLTTVRVVDSDGAVVISSITIVSQVVISPKYRQLQMDRMFQMSATSGSPPYTFSIISGSDLATLDSTTNTITPTGTAGLILVRVTDANGIFDDATVSIVDEYFPKWAFDIGYTTCIANSGLDYSAKCWGSNTASKLGHEVSYGASPGTMGDNLPPINFGSLTVKNVQVGNEDSAPCAIFSDDQVRCWGANWVDVNVYGGNSGQSGVGDASGEMQALTPISFGTGRTVKQLEVGNSFACVVLDNDKVKCWGAGDNGRLGNGSTSYYTTSSSLGDTLPYLDLGTGRIAKKIALADSAACALLDNDRVKCWGYGSSGRLGSGNSTSLGDDPGEMGDALPYVDLGTGRTVKKISGGNAHFCTILDNDLLKCWGAGASGRLGSGSTANIGDNPGEMGDFLSYVSLGTGRTVKDVIAGSTYSCAILDNDLVKCWGEAESGALGLGGTADQGDSPTEMGDALAYVDLGSGKTATKLHGRMGSDNVCVTLNDLSTKCWGTNSWGTLGIESIVDVGNNLGQMGDNLLPLNVGSGRSIEQMSISGSTSCAVLDDGSLKCWGRPAYGATGNDTLMCIGDDSNEINSDLPDTVLGTVSPIKTLHTNDYNSCALLVDGSLKCWGRQGYGMLLGISSYEMGAVPATMGDNLPILDFGLNLSVKQLALGSSHACAILNNDKVKCWGYANAGMLGNESTTNLGGTGTYGDSLPYVDLGTGRTAKMIAIGGSFACVILDNDKVKCWGSGANGQLGSGDTNNLGDQAGEMGDSLPYLDLGSGLTPLSITLGGSFGCALFSNNKVKCWGAGASGRLGAGDSLDRGDEPGEMGDNLPFVDLGTTDTIVKLQSGEAHSCVLFVNEKVKCWGAGGSGRIGSGNSSNLGDSSGEMGSNLPYINIGTRQVKDMFVGKHQTCLQLENDDLTCFGNNAAGSLRTGDFSALGDSSSEVGSNIFIIKKD